MLTIKVPVLQLNFFCLHWQCAMVIYDVDGKGTFRLSWELTKRQLYFVPSTLKP